MDEKTLFTTKEAAEYLGMSVANVKYHVHTSGYLKPIKPGHDLLFTRSDLDAFQAKRESGEIKGGRKPKQP